jgi:Uma2 family endonuclease
MGALPKTRMNVPDFLVWWQDQEESARFELVDGEVFAMGRDRISPNIAKMRAASALRDAIDAAGVDCQAFVDGIGVSPDARTYRLPDAAVNCGPLDPDAYILPNPIVVVEVVSPSSEERDVHAKLRDYFAVPSVAHYLINYDDRRYVVHHRRGQSGEAIETRFVTSGDIELAPPGIFVSFNTLMGAAEQ